MSEEIMIDIVFYGFATMLVVSASLMILLRNPVHSVLSLIASFIAATGLFILLGAEFVAMTLLIVYIGAVAILFLFIVMMLNMSKNLATPKAMARIAVGAFVAFILVANILLAISVQDFAIHKKYQIISKHHSTSTNTATEQNSMQIGKVLYTDYFYPFQITGLILLVAMLAAISLTHRYKKELGRKQDVCKQMARNKANSIDVVKVKTGVGVDYVTTD